MINETSQFYLELAQEIFFDEGLESDNLQYGSNNI